MKAMAAFWARRGLLRPAASLIAAVALASASVTGEEAEVVPKALVVTKEHPFLRVEKVQSTTMKGKTALTGDLIRYIRQDIPPGSHLHFQLLRDDFTVIDTEVYYIPDNDFDGSEISRRFFEYIDLTHPEISVIVVTPRSGPTSRYEDEPDVARRN